MSKFIDKLTHKIQGNDSMSSNKHHDDDSTRDSNRSSQNMSTDSSNQYGNIDTSISNKNETFKGQMGSEDEYNNPMKPGKFGSNMWNKEPIQTRSKDIKDRAADTGTMNQTDEKYIATSGTIDQMDQMDQKYVDRNGGL